MKSRSEIRRMELMINGELSDEAKTEVVMARVTPSFKNALKKYQINVSEVIVTALSKALQKKISEK